MRDFRLGNLTCVEIKDYLEHSALPGVIIPTGPIEEHGPHLPIGTDYLNAEKVAQMVAEKCNCLVAPTIPLMYCGIASECIGSYGIDLKTLEMIARDLTYKLGQDGFKKILWGTGHGGQSMIAIQDGIQNAKELHELDGTANFDASCIGHKVGNWWEKITIETENDGHAGEIETSAVLYLSPMIVGELPPADFHMKVGSKIIVSKSGINGDPMKATYGKGCVIVTSIVDYLVNWITSPVGSIVTQKFDPKEV